MAQKAAPLIELGMPAPLAQALLKLITTEARSAIATKTQIAALNSGTATTTQIVDALKA